LRQDPNHINHKIKAKAQLAITASCAFFRAKFPIDPSVPKETLYLQTIYSPLTLLTWYQVILKEKIKEGPA
jgi:hypothetical protein